LPTLPSFLTKPNPEIYSSDNFLILDVETTSYDKGDPCNKNNSLVLSQWKYNGELKYIFGNEFDMEPLLEDIGRADFVVAHHAKFDLGWMHRCGLDLHKVIVWDTEIAEYVLAGNVQVDKSLNGTLARYGLPPKEDIVGRLIKAEVHVTDIPKDWLLQYGLIDVERTYQLFIQQREKLRKLNLFPVQYTRCLLTPVLTDIERHGMHLDDGRVSKVYAMYAEELARLNREVSNMLGDINMNSPKQKVKAIYETLGFAVPTDFRGNKIVSAKTNAPKTDMDTIMRLKPKTSKQKRFIQLAKQLSKVQAAMSKALSKFKDCIDETSDHLITASLNQTITQTHRLSSSGKNYKAQFQNFAREFKPLMSARYPGWKMAEADEAQLEYRVAVFLGQDEAGIQDINNKVDSHAFTASIIFKEEWEECGGDKDTKLGSKVRQNSKEHTFKPLYGGQSGTDREREYYVAFKDKHQGIAAMQQRWIDEVLNTKQLVTSTGLIFYWPDTRITRSGYIVNTTNICNYPVQSLATADIVPIGMIYQWHLMYAANMKSFLVNTVHDSTIGEVAPGEESLYEEIADYALTDAVNNYMKDVYNIDFNVPLEAEIKIGEHWSDSAQWRAKYLENDTLEV
jgi:DNA polymerase I